MKIEILGMGCGKCVETERRVTAAIHDAGVTAEVSHVYDPKEIARRRVIFTPAVAIDGQVSISGKIPSVEEIKEAITAASTPKS